MTKELYEKLTTLSDEAQSVALDKCEELGLDIDRGKVPLKESFINLSANRDLVIDAIKTKKLIQLPITVQENLLSNVNSISNTLNALSSGTDEVVNLVNQIESFNFHVWEFGLSRLSEEYLGYETKLNQLKNLELKAKEASRSLDDSLDKKSEFEELLKQFSERVETIGKLQEESDKNAGIISGILNNATADGEKAKLSLAATQQIQNDMAQIFAKSTQSNEYINSLKEEVNAFFTEISDFKAAINETNEKAEMLVKANDEETKKLITTLTDLEGEIKEQIQKATGRTLFHSFQKRKEAIVHSKIFWGVIEGLLVLSVIGFNAWIIKKGIQLDAAFFMKLAINIPLVYAITFCAIQYTRERKLEEEYAFKSSISISLVSYKDLLEKLINIENAEESAKYTKFIIETIDKVFSSPTEKVFGDEKKEKGLTPKASNQFVKIIEPILKALDKTKLD